MTNSATLFAMIFLIALGVSVALHLWLASRQVRHVQLHRAAVPPHLAGRVSLEAHRKAADYTAARARLSIVDALVDAGVLLALTTGGGVAILAAWIASAPIGSLGRTLRSSSRSHRSVGSSRCRYPGIAPLSSSSASASIG